MTILVFLLHVIREARPLKIDFGISELFVEKCYGTIDAKGDNWDIALVSCEFGNRQATDAL